MEKNNFKTDSVRELISVDIQPLVNLLMSVKDDWDKQEDYDINRNKNYSLKQVNHVNFRWSDKKAAPPKYYDLPLWDKHKSILLPIMRKIVEPIAYNKGYFPRVMLAKMNPGTIIPEHIDGNTRGWIPHKIHVPILTNPDAMFFVDGKSYHFEVGKAYEVNNAAMHGVKNGGRSQRIHLIFEYLDASINKVPKNDLID